MEKLAKAAEEAAKSMTEFGKIIKDSQDRLNIQKALYGRSPKEPRHARRKKDRLFWRVP